MPVSGLHPKISENPIFIGQIFFTQIIEQILIKLITNAAGNDKWTAQVVNFKPVSQSTNLFTTDLYNFPLYISLINRNMYKLP